MLNPKLDIAIDVSQSRPWQGIVWHHSAGPDGATRDWDGIVKFHTSYRVDYRTVSPEEFDRLKAAGQGRVFQKPWRAVGYHGGTEWVDGQVVAYMSSSIAWSRRAENLVPTGGRSRRSMASASNGSGIR